MRLIGSPIYDFLVIHEVFGKRIVDHCLPFSNIFGYFFLEYESSYPGDQLWFNRAFRRQIFPSQVARFRLDMFRRRTPMSLCRAQICPDSSNPDVPCRGVVLFRSWGTFGELLELREPVGNRWALGRCAEDLKNMCVPSFTVCSHLPSNMS